jgi:murein DD-endopeptidase MepM/ murein hydrolase activator NlpD
MISKLSICRLRRSLHVGLPRRAALPLAVLLVPVVAIGIAVGGVPTVASASVVEAASAAASVGPLWAADATDAETAAPPVTDPGTTDPAPADLAPTDPASADPAPTDPAPSTPPATSPPAASPSDPATPPPAAPSAPPTDPPAYTPTDPPTDLPTDPTTDPTTNPPADPTTNPPADPGPVVNPEPSNPIPVHAVLRNTAAAAAAAAAQAAARATAARLAALTAADANLERASRAYDDAKLAYASIKAEHDAALDRATLVHGLAADASHTARASHRVVAALIRALAQQRGGDATVDVLLGGRAGGNLLYQLGTLDKLSELTGSLTTVRALAVADQKRADRLTDQNAGAQALVDSIPLHTAFAEMESAKAEFESATAELVALRTTSTAGLLGMTPLPIISDNGQPSARGWANPAVGPITDVFGPRRVLPLPGANPFHYATDIGAACGAGIYAATSGVVEAVGPLGTYGNWILIDHGRGIETGYAHISTGSTLVTLGESVIAGQVIARIGSTGASTGCHLHFEVRINGARVDPQPFMLDRGVALGDK